MKRGIDMHACVSQSVCMRDTKREGERETEKECAELFDLMPIDFYTKHTYNCAVDFV